MNFNFFSRIRILSFFIIVFALILIAKLFFVQVLNSNTYKEKADRQYATPSSNIFERNNIYFETRDEQLVSAAIQTMGFKLAINPSKIENIEDTFNKLKQVLIDLDYNKFKIKADKKSDPYEEIANRISKEDADKISVQKISGVSIYKEKWRFYPGGPLASHTLGFVGFNGDLLEGRYGIERQYNKVLYLDENSPYVNFFAEVFSNINKKISRTYK